MPAHAWLRFGSTRELARGPIAREFLGRRLVAFRTDSGKLAVLDARCSHMHADLGGGRVNGECIECPYHGWTYAADGRCVHIPATSSVPAFARQKSYATCERHGHVFFCHGARGPMPFFEGVEPDALVAGRPHRFDADCPWHLIGGNAFDLQHLGLVHQRRLLDEPVIDTPSPCARRVRYHSEVFGRTRADRCVRAFAGARVSISITVWSGNLALVVARFPRVTSYILVLATPTGAGRCSVDVLVFRERSRNVGERWFLEPASLFARGLLTRMFIQEDIARLAGIRCDTRTLLAEDRELAHYVDWLAQLPRAEE